MSTQTTTPTKPPSEGTSMLMSILMGAEISSLLPSKVVSFGWMRSSGSMGCDLFYEVAQRGRVPMSGVLSLKSKGPHEVNYIRMAAQSLVSTTRKMISSSTDTNNLRQPSTAASTCGAAAVDDNDGCDDYDPDHTPVPLVNIRHHVPIGMDTLLRGVTLHCETFEVCLQVLRDLGIVDTLLNIISGHSGNFYSYTKVKSISTQRLTLPFMLTTHHQDSQRAVESEYFRTVLSLFQTMGDIKHVEFRGTQRPEATPEGLLTRASNITSSLDLGETFTDVTSIKPSFLNECVTLKMVDMSSCLLLKEVGPKFLYRCRSLEGLNLSPLRNISKISDYFMNSCSSVTDLDLSPLSSVTHIGTAFLYGCSGLTSIDLSPFSETLEVGTYFMWQCSGITPTIDLSPLSNVDTIKGRFLAECSGLVSMDLSPLKKVHGLGWVLNEASGLKSVVLPSPTPLGGEGTRGAVSTPIGLLSHCKSIEVIDLLPLHNVTLIDQNFLEGCVGLKSIDLGPLSNVMVVSAGFLHKCTGLTTLDLSPFAGRLSQIHSKFLSECRGLTALDVAPLAGLSQIGPMFLEGCDGLFVVTKQSNNTVNVNKNRQLLDLRPLKNVLQYPTFFDCPVGCSNVVL